jgi:hypothetical protein
VAVETPFASAEELREVLERLLTDVDSDESAGPRLRAAKVPQRFVFTDLGVTLDVCAASGGSHSIAWDFDEAETQPVATFEMDSGVANRYLQGKLSLPVGVARGQVKMKCAKTRAALSLLPANRNLIAGYRDLIARDYPHLVIS